MKNFKRILALVLTLMFIVGSCASLSAFSGSTTTSWYAGAVSWIENTGVDTIGATAGDKIDRETFVKWVAKIESTYVDDDLWDDEVASTSFADVTEENYRAAIAYSQQRGFIRGYDASTFGPKDTLTFAQACAVIVRVLGCESWVEDQSAANWEYNYINIANKLGAIDSTWVGNVGFYVPAHEMTKGEAAYLLFKVKGHKVYKDGDQNFPIGTFGPLTEKTIGQLVLITKLDCKTTVVGGTYDAKYAEVVKEDGTKYGETGAANLMRYTDGDDFVNASKLGIFGNADMAAFWAKKNYQAYFNRTAYTADLDLEKNVEFQIFDTATQSFTTKGSMTAKEFQQLVRVGSGLSKDVGVTETYSIFNTVRVGSVVNLVKENKVDGKYISASTVGQHIVDTYRVAKSTGNTTLWNAGLANAYGSNANYAAMPTATYDATKDVTSWSKDGKKLILGEQEYTIVAPGKKFSGAAGELKVYGYKPVQVTSGSFYKFYDKTTGTAVWATASSLKADSTIYATAATTTPVTLTDVANYGAWKEASALVELTAEEAQAQILNAAQGEVSTVYSDMDGDGLYDVVAVLDYDKFITSNILNAAPGSKQAKGAPSMGAVILNKTVGSDGNFNTDAWTVSAGATGKMQLILSGSNKYNIPGYNEARWDTYGPYFDLLNLDVDSEDLVDLAEFKTGYIKNATATADGGYYALTITTADGDVNVLMPGIGSIKTTQKMEYTAYGATASQTLAAKGWMPFLTDFYSANFQYEFVDADGNYMYKETESGDKVAFKGIDVVAYYNDKPVHTIVPAGAKVDAATKYLVATPTLHTGSSFVTDGSVEYYEQKLTAKLAEKFVTDTVYYTETRTAYVGAMDELMKWTEGTKYFTKDAATYGKHVGLTTLTSGVEYYILVGSNYVVTTTFTAGTTYYTKNPESFTAVDTAKTTIKYADITKYYVGDAHTPATFTDFTYTYEGHRDGKYYLDGELQSTTTFVSGTAYYVYVEEYKATSTGIDGEFASNFDFALYTKDAAGKYTEVATSTKLDKAVTYYVRTLATYTQVTITGFDKDVTYYTEDAGVYTPVTQLSVIDGSKELKKASVVSYDKCDPALTSETFVSNTYYELTAETYTRVDTSKKTTPTEGYRYYTFEFATTPTTLSNFVTGTYYATVATEKVPVTTTSLTVTNLPTTTQFVTVTRLTQKVEGYEDEPTEGVKIALVGKDAGVFGYANKAAIDAKVSAWMTGKYVDFVEKDGKVIVALDTVDATETTEGFVISATKGENNTYAVKLAKTGAAQTVVTNIPVAATTLDELRALRRTAGATADDLKALYAANGNKWTGWIRVHDDQFAAFSTMPDDWVIHRMGGANIAEALSKVLAAQLTDVISGSVGVADYNVRASASSIFDVANAAQYRAIYGGSVVTGITAKTAPVFTHKNLIYVSMTQDAGTYSIMRVITPSTTTKVTAEGVAAQYFINYEKNTGHWLSNSWRISDYLFTQTTAVGENSDDAWFVPSDGVLLKSEKITTATVYDGKSYVSETKASDNSKDYTEYYLETIGTEPYYRLSDDGKKFETFFKTISTRIRTVAHSAEIDSVSGGQYVLVQNASGAAISATKADAKKLSTDERTYLSIGGKLFWQIIGGTPKYAGAYTTTESVSELKAAASDKKLADYTGYDKSSMALLSGKAMQRSDKGYIPGYYTITVDGETYTAAGSTKVVVMTPSGSTVVGQVFTVKELVDNGEILFATEYQIAYTGSNMTALTVIGELVDRTVKPVAEPKVVYLGSTYDTVLEAEETGTSFIVRTSVPAYNLDGTEFGYIYYEYNTTDKNFAAKDFDFLLGKAGAFYKVDADGKIQAEVGTLYSSKTSANFSDFINGEARKYSYSYPVLEDKLSGDYFKTATITSVADGKILATVGSSKNVDISGWNVKFVYTDIDGETLQVAGDSTTVSIYTFDVAVENGLYASYKKVALAQKLYDDYKSTSAKATYADALTAEIEALEAAKVATTDKYFNGAFWGTGSVSNSPLAVYFGKVKDSFGKNASLTFKYIVQNDVTYVIVPTFVLG